jgi:hypothetical protein
MRIPLRAACRLAVAGWFALAGLLCVVDQGRAATPPEKILPDSTVAFVKLQNAAALREAFGQSQIGQLWNDSAVKAWKEEILSRVDAESKTLKEKVGVTYRELFELPQGPTAIAFLKHADPKIPIVLLVIADAGTNSAKMTEVLTKATKQGELNGSKTSTETFKGVTIHVIQPPAPKAPAPAPAGVAKNQPEPPIVWSSQGSVFYISSDVDAMKDLIGHEQGRDNSLAASEAYSQSVKKLGSDTPVLWFVDLPKLIDLLATQGLAANANGGNNANQAQQAQAMIQVTGLNGLKAAAGSFTLNTPNFDSVTKVVVQIQGPPQGLLKAFRLPKISLQPESWVPASVASYQSISWDLDNAFVALNDLANMFQPGIIQVIEQQLVGPNGGEPLKFKQDLFDPLGDRVTIISDFKKPIKEDSERMLLAVALEDSKAFQNSLNKVIALTGGQPKKREFQNTTIYDFEMPPIAAPGANGGGPGGAGAVQVRGPVSVAIAKDTLFVSSEPTLLELVLRGGGPALADSAAYKAVAHEMPAKVSSMSYVRPDEQARLTYDMIKSGQFEQALQGAAVAGGPDLAKLAKIIAKEKMPDFSVFAKYLAQGGRYSESTEDGIAITAFSLRKTKP